jgi:hypothetical protein
MKESFKVAHFPVCVLLTLPSFSASFASLRLSSSTLVSLSSLHIDWCEPDNPNNHLCHPDQLIKNVISGYPMKLLFNSW